MSTCFRRKITRTWAALIFMGAAGIVSSVKAAGLPGEFVISDRWRHVYSKYSGVTNPAFINEENYTALRFMFATTLERFYLHEAGLTVPLDLHSAVGASWMMQGASAYEVTNEQGGATGATIQDQSNFIALTYANNVWNRLTVGGNLNIITQNLANMDDPNNPLNGMRFGFGIDIGLSWKLMQHPMLGNHLLGFSTQNIFTHILDSEEIFARALRFSLLSNFWESRISYGTDFVLKDVAPEDAVWIQTNGLSSVAEGEWEFTHKLGFNILRIFKIYMLAGMNQDGFDHYGFAFGANMPGFFNGRDIEGIMQFVSIDENASTMTFYARTELGRHREENYARKMARRGTLGPNNLYNQALRLFHQGECYQAYWIFSQIAVEYPDFFRNDMVNYYQGACHECLDLRKSAEMIYNRTKDDHSRSVVVPMADLGLMRVYYRNNDHARVDVQFEALNTLGVPDSIKFHAFYVMGQSFMKRGNYNEARRLFTMIPDTHPDYVFAYHSAAVVNMLSDNITGAIADLEQVIQFKPENKSQEEMINRSYVFLGFLYYEDLETEGALARAVTALRNVPRNSYYYQDALLGLGWTALKARQWSDCISVGSDLSRNSTDPVLQSEGDLIQAYAHAMNRNWGPSVSLLEGATSRLNAYSGPSAAEQGQKSAEYGGNRADYEMMGLRIDELGQARQSSIVQTSIDSLNAPHVKLKASIDEFYKFTDEHHRAMFFARSLEQVKEDIDYAYARFSRYAGSRGVQRQLERSSGEAEAIDDELERLRRELEGE